MKYMLNLVERSFNILFKFTFEQTITINIIVWNISTTSTKRLCVYS
jgi:hypothetical protein